MICLYIGLRSYIYNIFNRHQKVWMPFKFVDVDQFTLSIELYRVDSPEHDFNLIIFNIFMIKFDLKLTQFWFWIEIVVKADLGTIFVYLIVNQFRYWRSKNKRHIFLVSSQILWLNTERHLRVSPKTGCCQGQTKHLKNMLHYKEGKKNISLQ